MTSGPPITRSRTVRWGPRSCRIFDELHTASRFSMSAAGQEVSPAPWFPSDPPPRSPLSILRLSMWRLPAMRCRTGARNFQTGTAEALPFPDRSFDCTCLACPAGVRRSSVRDMRDGQSHPRGRYRRGVPVGFRAWAAHALAPLAGNRSSGARGGSQTASAKSTLTWCYARGARYVMAKLRSI